MANTREIITIQDLSSLDFTCDVDGLRVIYPLTTLVEVNNGDGTSTLTYTDENGDTFDFCVRNCDAPTADAVNDTATTDQNIPVSGDVSLNDVPCSFGVTTFLVYTTPANGSVVFNMDGTYTYTPNSGYSGTDSFDYSMFCDGVLIDTATITITITAAPVEACTACNNWTSEWNTAIFSVAANGLEASVGNSTPGGNNTNANNVVIDWGDGNGPQTYTIALNTTGASVIIPGLPSLNTTYAGSVIGDQYTIDISFTDDAGLVASANFVIEFAVDSKFYGSTPAPYLGGKSPSTSPDNVNCPNAQYSFASTAGQPTQYTINNSVLSYSTYTGPGAVNNISVNGGLLNVQTGTITASNTADNTYNVTGNTVAVSAIGQMRIICP